jgi:uncharacterized protein
MRLTLLALAVLCAAAAPLRAQSTDTIPLPTAWQVAHVVMLFDGPQAADTTAAMRATMQAHIQYQLRLQRDGLAVAGGGFATGAPADLTGLTLLRTTDLAEARRIAEQDPAVRAGRFHVVVRTWYVPAGRLPPP